jgi:WD40 repeat protein
MLHDVATAKERLTLRVEGDWTKWITRCHVRFSPASRILATSRGGVVKLWDTATGKERATLSGYLPVYDPDATPFSPDGKTLVTVETDRTVKLCNVATGKERAALRGHELPYV